MRTSTRFPGLGIRSCALLAAVLALSTCIEEVEILTTLDAGVDAGTDGGMASPAFSLAAGDAHTCAIRAGALYCWGQNTEGQVGIAAPGPVTTPVQVGSGVTWVQVVTGEAHSCALDTSGAVWCWGANGAGQLGVGDLARGLMPAPVSLPRPATAVTSTANFTCALTDDAALWCWGSNFEGQLGLSDTFPGADRLVPVQVPHDAGWRSAAAGQGHTCAIQLDGSMWCWGRNTAGMAGQGDAGLIQYRTPTPVPSAPSWLSVHVSQEFSCAIAMDGSVWCWGNLPLAGPRRPSPVAVLDGGWARLSTNVFNVCAMGLGGEATCWGRNLEGQLGLGDRLDRPNPTEVPGGTLTHLSVGRFHTCQRRAGGTIRCTGKNTDGQLGVGDTMDRSDWTPVVFP